MLTEKLAPLFEQVLGGGWLQPNIYIYVFIDISFFWFCLGTHTSTTGEELVYDHL